MLDKFKDLEYGLILTNSYEEIYKNFEIPNEFIQYKHNDQFIYIKENECSIIFDVKECFCNKNIIYKICEKISNKLFKKYLIILNFDIFNKNIQNNIKIFVEKNLVLSIFHFTKYSKILESFRSISFNCIYKIKKQETPLVNEYLKNYLKDFLHKNQETRREILYTLLINGMSVADIIKELLNLKSFPLNCYEDAANYEYRSIFGNYDIYHLEAFANLLIKYK